MSKKIIAAALLVLAVTVLFAACKKDEYVLSHTVPAETGVINVFEDKDGNEFVTNTDGDLIPVTTDKDGFLDDVEDLITATTDPSKKPSKKPVINENSTAPKTSTTTTTTTTSPSSTTTTTEPSSADDDTSTTETTTESTTKKKPVIVNGDSIDWNDIV